MNTPQQQPAQPKTTVRFVLSGVVFTGEQLAMWTEGEGDIRLAVAVEGWTLNGRWYPAQADDSAVHVSATLLVE